MSIDLAHHAMQTSHGVARQHDAQHSTANTRVVRAPREIVRVCMCVCG